MIDGTYKVHWMDNQTSPEEILELVVCGCKNGKCTEQCQCVLLQISCTDILKHRGKCYNEVPELFFISDEKLE